MLANLNTDEVGTRSKNEVDLVVFRTIRKEWLVTFDYVQQSLGVLQHFQEDVQKVGIQPRSWETDDSYRQKVQVLVKKHLKLDINTDMPSPVMSLLEDVMLQLTISSEMDVLLRDGPVNAPLQRMLTEFGTVEIIVSLIKALIKMVEPENIRTLEHGSELFLCMRYLFQFLMLMSKDHIGNTTVLYGDLDWVLQILGYGFQAVKLVTEICRTQHDCAARYQQQIWGLAQSQRKERYITFLSVLVNNNGRPIVANQDIVTGIIKKEQQAGRLDDLFDPGFVRFWTKFVPEGGPSDPQQQEDKAEQSKREMGFHIGFVRLAALLCAGRHQASIEFFIQWKQLKFEKLEVLNIVTDNEIAYSVRTAYAELLRTLFVDRSPMQTHPALQEARILSDSQGNEDREASEAAASLADLKNAMSGILIEEKGPLNTDNNDRVLFLSVVFEIVELMILYGVYDQGSHSGDLQHKVLVLGNETLDLGRQLLPFLHVNAAEENTDGTDSTQRTDFVDSQYFMTEENHVIADAKLKLLAIVRTLFDLRDSKRIELVMESFFGLELGAPDLRYTLKPGSAATTIVEADGAAEEEANTISYKNPITDEAESTQSPPPRIVSIDPEVIGFQPVKASAKAVARTAAAAARVKAKTSSFSGNTSIIRNEKKAPKQLVQLLHDVVNVRAFSRSTETSLISTFLDIVHYDHIELSLAGFECMLLFLAQSVVISRSLRKVLAISPGADVDHLCDVSRSVGEFRKLKHFLRSVDSAQEIKDLFRKMGDLCAKSPRHQIFFGCLQMVAETCELINLGLPSDLMNSILVFAGALCQNCANNQKHMSNIVEALLLPLLHDPTLVESTCECLIGIVINNQEMCEDLGPMLVAEVVEVTKKYGRNIELLRLLDKLLVVTGDAGEQVAVPQSQSEVCKGAMLCPKLLEVDGEVDVDDWGGTKAIDRISMLQMVLEDRTGADAERSKLHAHYFAKSMQVLAKCAVGLNPSTEMQCAALLPFTEMIKRLHEIFDDPSLQHTEEDVSGMKASYMDFFRHVFIDTNSTVLLKALAKPSNGIWTIDSATHGRHAKPIAQSLLQDLELLYDDDGLDDKSARYIFEQAIPFFTMFASTLPLKNLHPSEWSCAEATMMKAATAATAAIQKGRDLSAIQKAHLNNLVQTVGMYVGHASVERLRRHQSLANVSDTAKNSDTAEEWQTKVTELIAQVRRVFHPNDLCSCSD